MAGVGRGETASNTVLPSIQKTVVAQTGVVAVGGQELSHWVDGEAEGRRMEDDTCVSG